MCKGRVVTIERADLSMATALPFLDSPGSLIGKAAASKSIFASRSCPELHLSVVAYSDRIRAAVELPFVEASGGVPRGEKML